MLGTLIAFFTFLFIGFVIKTVSNLISRANWVEQQFPQLSNKLSKTLNLEITNVESLFGVTIGPENNNHLLLGKHKTKLSVKYFYNFKNSFSYDIIKWEYGQEQSIDEIILSIKTNIEKTESQLSHSSK